MRTMSVHRREVLAGAGALVAGAVVGSVAQAAEHKHHALTPATIVLDNAIACGATGELCIDHCFELLKKGNTPIAGCAESVHEMLAVNHQLKIHVSHV